MKVRVGAHDLELQLVDKVDERGSCGEYDAVAHTIKVLNTQTPSGCVETFWHEVTHAIIAGIPISDEMEEVVACMMGSGLAAFFRDNPECICSLLQTMTEEDETNGRRSTPDDDDDRSWSRPRVDPGPRF